ncbi:hypothetical protein ADIMK_1566 [Marinobacterium lacunae]|uniref:Uncharacterized protein n=1 Tax=Marinobacterium lacunae TaxID=1232683 RepID=A0A081G0L5_9GAMM|nr:hypothetical protein [Marinobacterium lacunae]KEA64320.1 hypothetical protein ADIMK_1566 [Marinobacterium lacunae]
MGRIAQWLDLFNQAEQLHGDIMQLLSAAPLIPEDSTDEPDPDTNLVALLTRWKQLTSSMDTASLGPEASTIHNKIAALLKMNTEIGEGASRVRDFIASQLRQQRKNTRNLQAYATVSKGR